MKKSKSFLSMPIISVTEGQQVGTVRGLVVNPNTMEVAALLVDQKGFFKEQRVIPFAKVKSVGEHAITVDKVNHAEKAVNLPEIVSLLKDKVSVLNAKVMTDSGQVLGVVEEFYIDCASGKIVCLDIVSNFLTGLFKGRARLGHEDLITMGKDVIIAAAGAEDRLTPIETGISETLKSVVDSTSNLWYSSLHRTKEWSKHLARGKDRIELLPPEPAAYDDNPQSTEDVEKAESEQTTTDDDQAPPAVNQQS